MLPFNRLFHLLNIGYQNVMLSYINTYTFFSFDFQSKLFYLIKNYLHWTYFTVYRTCLKYIKRNLNINKI